MNSPKDLSLESERSFEELLSRAAPRPVPEAGEIRMARAAVKAEWRAAIRVRRRRRYAFAAAASVFVAAALFVATIRVTDPGPVAVAAITASKGAIYMLGEESELEAIADAGTVSAGQTIETGSGAALGMAWKNGGSLRVDEETRILFASTDIVELKRGRVYFDADSAGGSPLIVRTPLGDVSHVGTQYMVAVDLHTLSVSVREGRVSVAGRFHDGIAEAGQRMTFRDTRAPSIDPILPWGAEWRWVETTASHGSFDGRPVIDVIEWAARETGLSIEFAGADVGQDVRSAAWSGELSDEPRAALRQALLGIDLALRIEDGVIVISEPETRDD